MMLPRKPSFSAASSSTAIMRCDCSGPRINASSRVVIRLLSDGGDIASVMVAVEHKDFSLRNSDKLETRLERLYESCCVFLTEA